MCAPIPKGKWAWKYDRCIACHTTKIKHKGKGLCLHCFDKKRAKKSRRADQLKAQHDRWYLKVKDTPEYKEYCKNNFYKYRHNPKSAYRYYLTKIVYRRLKFRRIARNIILNKGRVLKRHQGVSYCCDGCYKNCLIQSPFKDLTNEMNDLTFFKKEFIKVCKKYERVANRQRNNVLSSVS